MHSKQYYQLALTRFFANTHLVSNRLNHLSRRQCFQSQVIIACICQPIALDSQTKSNERDHILVILYHQVTSCQENNLNLGSLSWKKTGYVVLGVLAFPVIFISSLEQCYSNGNLQMTQVCKSLLLVCDKLYKLKLSG